MQASLKTETNAKAEALRFIQKIETEIYEPEIAQDHSNMANAKHYQTQYRDVDASYEEECRHFRIVVTYSYFIVQLKKSVHHRREQTRNPACGTNHDNYKESK